jgi:hypothetical protein
MNTTEGLVVAGTGVFGSWINLFKHPVAIVGEIIDKVIFK